MDQPDTLPQSGGSYQRHPDTGALIPITQPPTPIPAPQE